MRRLTFGSLFVLILSLPGPCAVAQQLQSFRDCVIGKRVHTNDGKRGTITRLDQPWSYCWVRFDDGREAEFLYSLLNAEGGSATSDRLAVRLGMYECIVNGSSTMNMRITSANSYSIPDGAGRFHLEPNGRIVFETGPLKSFHSMLLSGGTIGLNTDGGSFYPLACEYRNSR